MPTWTRWENWELTEPRFVELAIEGSTLFVRTGTCKLGGAPKLETRVLSSSDAAREARATEEKAWTKKKFVREKTFEAPIPAQPPPMRRTRAKGRWPTAERSKLQRAFFDRLRAVGIDPAQRFDAQAESSTRGARDANARASMCLEIAEAVLRVEFRRTYFGRDLTGEHDPFEERNPQPVPFASFARFYQSPAHVFSIAARASHDASTGASDGRS